VNRAFDHATRRLERKSGIDSAMAESLPYLHKARAAPLWSFSDDDPMRRTRSRDDAVTHLKPTRNR